MSAFSRETSRTASVSRREQDLKFSGFNQQLANSWGTNVVRLRERIEPKEEHHIAR